MLKMYALRVDIGKLYVNIGCPILLIMVFLIVLPLSTGYIDCRISCRRCHENTEHPSVLEVYCAMCEECKQRRRERMQGRSVTPRTTTMGIVSPLARMGIGVDSSEGLARSLLSPGNTASVYEKPQTQQSPQTQPAPDLSPMQNVQRQAYQMPQVGWPIGCPTPPVCSESEEEPQLLTLPAPPPAPPPPTTTTTTTTPPPPPPCPPVMPCRKKPMAMPMYPCIPCMPACPCPYPQTTSQPTTEPPTTHMDYHYVYIGIPKNVLRSL